MTLEEETHLRQLAAGQCTIQKVIDALGPMSLWSKKGMDAEIKRAVEAEREACAKMCDEQQELVGGEMCCVAMNCAAAIRARSNT